MESVRAFFALEISDDMRRRIADLGKEVAKSGADVKVVEAENLHVTMKFLGEVPVSKVEEISGAIQGMRIRRFELEARGAGAFPDRRMIRVVWVGIGRGSVEVTEVARKLDDALGRFGFPKEKRFVPHITVGRVRSQRNREALQNLLDTHSQTVFGTTLVDRLVLKKSTLTGSGPVYTDLKVFPFE
ncbi:MAG: RNA 2',3'-cyclic phosphodiesterase [Candidatus Methanosuratincola petrocarbonis]|nr:RNA 2',3'-cyclic phosphodiesterase [Candidatus Methanosuratincola sp.]